MAYKSRSKPVELEIMEIQNARMQLTAREKRYLLNLAQGYAGENMFDAWTEKLQCECLVLNDLLLKSNNTHFQIDSLLITSEAVSFYEVKNFTGDFYLDGNKFFKHPEYEILNPFHQLSRSESLLRQLLLSFGVDIPIEGYLVFINPEFTLYQAPIAKEMILPTQIQRHFKNLNATQSKLTSKHRSWADQLVASHLDEFPYKQLPPYNYEKLRKGIPCSRCRSFSTLFEWSSLICKRCGHVEKLAEAVMRAVREFKLLFPDKKVTTKIIHDWCQAYNSKRKIRNILNKNLTRVGKNRSTHYE